MPCLCQHAFVSLASTFTLEQQEQIQLAMHALVCCVFCHCSLALGNTYTSTTGQSSCASCSNTAAVGNGAGPSGSNTGKSCSVCLDCFPSLFRLHVFCWIRTKWFHNRSNLHFMHWFDVI